MGKSPGKWFKSLLAKKSSKSNLSKRGEKPVSASIEESLLSSNVAASNLSVAPPSKTVDSDSISRLQQDGGGSLSSKENKDNGMNFSFGSQDDPERIKHEEAAKKAQAAFRGYQARKAFRTLKGIIRLQALIRGHLVRRQAVATLCCVHAIVRFQALARGRKARYLNTGIEVQKINLGGKCSELLRVSPYTRMEKLSKYLIIRKLLASSSTRSPLWLQYGPGEPNSASAWVKRWTKLRFWEPCSLRVENLGPESQTKTGSNQSVLSDQGRSKRNGRKLSSGSVEKSSTRSTSEYEKPKRSMRNISGQPISSVREQPKSELHKVKQSLRKLTNSAEEASNRLEGAKSASLDAVVKNTSGSAEKRKDMTVILSRQPDPVTNLKPTDVPAEESLDQMAIIDSQPANRNGTTEYIKDTSVESLSKDNNIGNENLKASQRRASLPAKVDQQDNGMHSGRKVPSYMAPTESAKAKLRAQGSPRFSQDVVETNGITRRYSLPSSVNGKLSSLSPRAQGFIQASGRDLFNSDKSLSSSRDAGDKTIRAEWRR